jgi:hypothetical protein
MMIHLEGLTPYQEPLGTRGLKKGVEGKAEE